MLINLQTETPAMRYQWMTQAVVPRPIAWVLTENDDDGFNLAPFSYFNALCSAPPLIGFSLSRKPQGEVKDTLRNIRTRKRFVVHIAAAEQLTQLNESSATLEYGVSETQQLQIKTEPFQDAFRITECPIAMLCALHKEIALDEEDNQKLILGEISFLHAADEAMDKDAKGRPIISAPKINPIARLSAGNYARLGEFIQLQRPA